MQRSQNYDPIMYTDIPLHKFYNTSEQTLGQGIHAADLTKLSEA